MNGRVKIVSFAYPTSATAKSMHCDRDGCWIIETFNPASAGSAHNQRKIGPYATKADAEAKAELLSEPWWAPYVQLQRTNQL